MLKKIIREMSDDKTTGFINFSRLDESYYENEEVDIRKISKDMTSRESKVTSEIAKIIVDRLEANARLGKKEGLDISKEKINNELNRMLRVIKGKVTKSLKLSQKG